MTRTLSTLSITALLLATAMISGQGITMATSQPEPITIRVDGNVLGTAAGSIEYDLGAGEVHIYTNEGVFGCGQDLIFMDRLEPRT